MIFYIFVALLFSAINPTPVTIFYCGFSGNFCGQSKIDDVNPKVSTVILAFGNTASDGKVIVDSANFPTALVNKWKSSGKRVLLSIGGQKGDWRGVFKSAVSINNFVASLAGHVKKYNLDGVDLDIEGYHPAPRIVANTIIQLKKAIGNKLLVVSPQAMAVYLGSRVPGLDQAGVATNFFVPIIKLADRYIDYYQPQAYNSWYGGFPGGSFQYLKDVYLNWRNMQGLSPNTKPLPGFSGVKGQKLILGVMASKQAGAAAYYAQPSVITQLKNDLKSKKLPLRGFMMWSSYWDKANNFVISNTCAA